MLIKLPTATQYTKPMSHDLSPMLHTHNLNCCLPYSLAFMIASCFESLVVNPSFLIGKSPGCIDAEMQICCWHMRIFACLDVLTVVYEKIWLHERNNFWTIKTLLLSSKRKIASVAFWNWLSSSESSLWSAVLSSVIFSLLLIRLKLQSLITNENLCLSRCPNCCPWKNMIAWEE